MQVITTKRLSRYFPFSGQLSRPAGFWFSAARGTFGIGFCRKVAL